MRAWTVGGRKGEPRVAKWYTGRGIFILASCHSFYLHSEVSRPEELLSTANWRLRPFVWCKQEPTILSPRRFPFFVSKIVAPLSRVPLSSCQFGQMSRPSPIPVLTWSKKSEQSGYTGRGLGLARLSIEFRIVLWFDAFKIVNLSMEDSGSWLMWLACELGSRKQTT